MKTKPAPTPRTDASCFNATTEKPESGDYELEVCYSSFARRLEREVAHLTAERDELMKDRVRLDWLRDVLNVPIRNQIDYRRKTGVAPQP